MAVTLTLARIIIHAFLYSGFLFHVGISLSIHPIRCLKRQFKPWKLRDHSLIPVSWEGPDLLDCFFGQSIPWNPWNFPNSYKYFELSVNKTYQSLLKVMNPFLFFNLHRFPLIYLIRGGYLWFLRTFPVHHPVWGGDSCKDFGAWSWPSRRPWIQQGGLLHRIPAMMMECGI